MIRKRPEKDTINPPGQIVNHIPKTLKEEIDRMRKAEEWKGRPGDGPDPRSIDPLFPAAHYQDGRDLIHPRVPKGSGKPLKAPTSDDRKVGKGVVATHDSGVAAAPEFDRDTDGELLIDWSPNPDRMLSLSLRSDGRLSYAFHWDGEATHGTAHMPAGVDVPTECSRCQGTGRVDANQGYTSETCPVCEGEGHKK